MIYIQNFNYGIQRNIWLTEMYNNQAIFNNVLAAWYTHICPAFVIIIIPQLQWIWKGISCLHLAHLSVCVSVHLSVCLSVDRSMSSLYPQKYLSDIFHVYTSYQATSEDVSHLNVFNM